MAHTQLFRTCNNSSFFDWNQTLSRSPKKWKYLFRFQSFKLLKSKLYLFGSKSLMGNHRVHAHMKNYVSENMCVMTSKNVRGFVVNLENFFPFVCRFLWIWLCNLRNREMSTKRKKPVGRKHLKWPNVY